MRCPRIVLKRVILVTALLLFCAFPPFAGAAKSYTAERFDVDWNLRKDGVLEVTETAVFRFEGGPFTYVYRELPVAYADGVEGIEASQDGQPLAQGSNAGQVEIAGRSPIKVTWHFAPTTDATHTFQLKYRVLGMIRQTEGADLFWWNALPTDYSYPIVSSTVHLTYPTSLEPSGPPEVRRGTAQMAQTAGQVSWTTQNVKPNAPLTVAVPFPKGSLIAALPEWQAREASGRAAMPGFLGAAGLALVAGLAGLSALWVRARRPVTAVAPAPAHTSILPAALTPALAGTLVAANGRPNATHALGTIFDLAQRGILVIEESPEKHWYRSREFDIRLLDPAAAGLRPHEQGLLGLMFTDKHGPTDTVRMSEVGNRLSTKVKQFAAPLTEELETAGLIDPQRKATAKRFSVAGLVLLGLVLPLGALCLLLLNQYGGWPFLLTAVAFVLAMVAFIMSAAYSPLSDEGAREAARWRSFQDYLKDVVKGREPAWDLRLFERYLPYAAAFGLAEGWAKAFQKRGGAAVPAWFHAVASGDNNIGAFVAMTSAAHSASAAASGGAGGGGAGGGGGSGAG